MSNPYTAETQNAEWLPEKDWLKRHEVVLSRRDAALDAELVFLGDSITAGWLGSGAATWNESVLPLKPVNLGIGGDETQHILWRIEDGGTLDGLDPKALILLIGTNNIGNSGYSAKETAKGVRALLDLLKERLPTTKILLLAVFPRDEKPGTPFRSEVNALNGLIADFADDMVEFYDVNHVLLNEDETLSADLQPDFLHLSATAYDLVWKAMQTKVKELLA